MQPTGCDLRPKVRVWVLGRATGRYVTRVVDCDADQWRSAACLRHLRWPIKAVHSRPSPATRFNLGYFLH